jgi:uncharacterized protein (UPF0332 family)
MGNYSDEIKLNVETAITNLQAAKEWIQDGQYEHAASRASESAFCTASALLLDEEIESSKHGDVITLLQEVFVNGRKLTKEQGTNLNWLFAMRNAEERPASIRVTAEEAHRAVQIAESFFEAAKVILEA